MLLTIPGLLNLAQLEKIREILAGAGFVDGRLTAGFAAARVKRNLELKQDPERLQRLIRIIMASLAHNERFRFGALPHRVADPIVARYEPGMTYGDHVDDPIMGTSGPRFRTDVSMTIFLNPPESYEGGELTVRTPFGDRKVMLPAGDAVIYPSSSLHHVAEVTAGQRLVAIEGSIPSPFQRPSGCPFHPRCSRAMAGRCEVDIPAITQLNDQHVVRCLLYEPEKSNA